MAITPTQEGYGKVWADASFRRRQYPPLFLRRLGLVTRTFLSPPNAFFVRTSGTLTMLGYS